MSISSNDAAAAVPGMVYLLSDRTGRMYVLDAPVGTSYLAAARRLMRLWGVPPGAPADRTYYQNAELFAVPRRLMPDSILRDAAAATGDRDVRRAISARRARTIEVNHGMYRLTECVHPKEPACPHAGRDAGGGGNGAPHDWEQDPNGGGGATTTAYCCARPGCTATKSETVQFDDPLAYETDVPLIAYGMRDAVPAAADDAGTGTVERQKNGEREGESTG